MLGTYARLPYLGSKLLKKQSEQLKRLTRKMIELQDVFKFFSQNQWIFQSELV